MRTIRIHRRHPSTECSPSNRRAFDYDWYDRYTKAELREFHDAYDNSIAFQDSQLRTLFENLQRRGLLEKTVVIITSDHGELFGERRQSEVLHMNGLNSAVLHVPLMFVAPDIRAQRITMPVSIRDVPATVLALARIDGNGEIPGTSLIPKASGPNTDIVPSLALSEFRVAGPGAKIVGTGNRLWSLRTGNYHFVVASDSTEELYDVEQDRWNKNNLIGSPQTAALLQSFRVALASASGERWIAELPAPASAGRPVRTPLATR